MRKSHKYVERFLWHRNFFDYDEAEPVIESTSLLYSLDSLSAVIDDEGNNIILCVIFDGPEETSFPIFGSVGR